MKTIFVIAICFITTICFGQTKLISHKSHSGSNANFRLAMNKNLFDITQSNFGIVTKIVKNKVDTVVLKSSNTIILHRKTVENKQGKLVTKSFLQTINKKNNPKFFNLKNQNGLQELIKEMYGANVDSVVFIGFDKNFFKK